MLSSDVFNTKVNEILNKQYNLHNQIYGSNK